MLFNSYIFILLFLPITLTGFYLIGGKGHHRIALSWLIAASLFFYGWWNPAYLGLLIGSIFANYAIGVALGSVGTPNKKTLLIIGITGNLMVIGYFKYTNFFIDNLNWATGTNYNLEAIILPLAISFFTFQQIAYLADAYYGKTKEYNFLHYCLFVTFFPQLIAGPIVHHKEMLPQFAKDRVYRFNHVNLAIGITIFALGLFKKVILADSIAVHATPVFDAAHAGAALSFIEAWTGALAYTFQLYFDFSGYSDMAIGLARMFGIKLPINFNSPYKANNIIDFWRRWHITLSRFLRDYLYIPLGGNRHGQTRRYANLMIVMLLGGLWHGAGWTFVLWGLLHGAYLSINHIWHKVCAVISRARNKPFKLSPVISRGITFIAIVVAWVPFRAADIGSAGHMLGSMFDIQGAFSHLIQSELVELDKAFLLILLLWLIAWLMPNTLQIMYRYQPVTDTILSLKLSRSAHIFKWRPATSWAIATSLLMIIALMKLHTASEFLYFQF